MEGENNKRERERKEIEKRERERMRENGGGERVIGDCSEDFGFLRDCPRSVIYTTRVLGIIGDVYGHVVFG